MRNFVPRTDNNEVIGDDLLRYEDLKAVKVNGKSFQDCQYRQLTSGFTTSSTTLTDVTGLHDFALEAGSTYYVLFVGNNRQSVNGNGLNLTVNCSGAVSSVNIVRRMKQLSTPFWDYERITALDGGNAGSSSNSNLSSKFSLEGLVTTSGAVTMTLRTLSENGANSTTIREGSFGLVIKIA